MKSYGEPDISQVTSRMPRKILGKPDSDWRCRGRVIRVDRNGLASGCVGLGVQFDYYELLSA